MDDDSPSSVPGTERVGLVVEEVAASVFSFFLPIDPVHTGLHTRFGSSELQQV